MSKTDSEIRVYIFYHELDEKLVKILKDKLEEVRDFGRFEAYLMLFNDEHLKSFPIKSHDHVSLATYIRLLIPKYLPSDLDKIIYLDSDLIVRHDLSDLWEIDLGNHYLAAVNQGRTNPMKFYRHFYQFKDFNREEFCIFNIR